MNLCLLGNALRQIRPDQLVTGYSIATQDLTKGLLCYSTAENIYCLQSPWQAHAVILQKLIGEPGLSASRIHMVNELDLLFHGASSMPEIDVLHSVKEDPVSLLSLRESIGKPIPLTFVFHGIVEQHLLTDTFYPLAALPFQPYDAILCPSVTVQKTIERILERLESLCQGALEQRDPAYKLLRGKLKHKIQLRNVPLGIDLLHFFRRDPQLMKRKFHFPSDSIVLLWIGRFSEVYKADLYPLLFVFARITANCPEKNLLLVLMGSEDDKGQYRKQLAQTTEKLGISGKIRILLNEEVADRAELISACDIFTSPVDNLQETFGLTPVEAMACGVPQVVSDWAGYRDTVRNGQTGFLVKTYWADCMDDIAALDCFPSDPPQRRNLYRYLSVRSTAVDIDDYQRKLMTLIEDDELRIEMGRASMRIASEQYGLEQYVYNTEQVWSELTERAESEAYQRDNYVPMLNLCSDFQEYPSYFVNESSSFKLRDLHWQERLASLPRRQDFESYVEEAALPELIIKQLSEHDPISGMELFQRLSRFTPQQIMRELLFLCKYGFVCTV